MDTFHQPNTLQLRSARISEWDCPDRLQAAAFAMWIRQSELWHTSLEGTRASYATLPSSPKIKMPERQPGEEMLRVPPTTQRVEINLPGPLNTHTHSYTHCLVSSCLSDGLPQQLVCVYTRVVHRVNRTSARKAPKNPQQRTQAG